MAHSDKVGETLNSIPSTSAIISTSSLPEDVIIFILKRLPVKSILQFKCVSKSWLSLLSSPEFVSLHLQQSSQNPQNHAFIICIGDITHSNAMSLINSNSFETAESLPIRNPCPADTRIVEFVGTFNGLVCLSFPLLREMVLWNHAMNLYKTIRVSHLWKAGENVWRCSHGLAYDSVHDDYKIIRMAYFKPKSESSVDKLFVKAEVYSVNLDSWKEVKVDMSFIVNGCNRNVIAKGVPHWRAIIYQPSVEAAKPEFDSIVWYDCHQESFKYVPWPQFGGDNSTVARLVDWKGNLAVVVYSPSRDKSDYLDIWEYGEIEKCWRRISTYGPVPVDLERVHGVLQCSREGIILAESIGWELILYDPVTNHVKEFSFPNGNSFQACSYNESLVSFKGMQQVNEQDKDKLYH